MENNNESTENIGYEQQGSDLVCRNCGSLDIEEGYDLELCPRCRKLYANRPIPVLIKIASIGLIIVLIVGMIKFTSNIEYIVKFKRGQKAERELNYVTAMKNYEEVNEHYPNNDKVMTKLLKSYYENNEIDKAYEIFYEIAGDHPETKKMDSSLVKQVNDISAKMSRYYSASNEIAGRVDEISNASNSELISILESYIKTNKDDIYCRYILADIYFDEKQYKKCEELMSNVLATDNEFYSGYILRSAAYREEGFFKEAEEDLNNVLSHNHENISAIVGLSKLELKRKNNSKALEYAKKAIELDGDEAYVIANIALAYHFNGMIQERDEAYEKYKSFGEDDEYTLNLLDSIFSGSLEWQSNN